MTYSDRALEFTLIPTRSQVRLEDRVSYLYLEYAKVHGDRTGVWAVGVDDDRGRSRPWSGQLQLPISTIAVLAMGPGTSITQPAMRTLANAGATVMFTGGGGLPSYAAAVPTTSSARWAQAQAVMWASPNTRLTAARLLYSKRFPEMPIHGEGTPTIERLRGLEGRYVRDTYAREARKHRVLNFRRKVDAEDNVNVALNIGNAILYGCAASVCSALALNPALGIIHQGNARAFLHDLADVYKLTTTVPVAFAAAHAPTVDLPNITRRNVRTALHSGRVIPRMLETTVEILTPHLVNTDRDVLIGDDGTTVTAHTNHSSRAPEC